MVSPVSMRKVRKEPKRLSSPSADDSRSVDGQFVAQGLAGLAALHQRGFVVGCTGDLAPFEEGGVLRLDPARVDPIYLSSGELDLLAVKRVKNELEMFHTAISEVFAFASLVRDFGNWIRRIRVDSRQLPQMAEYRVWIDQFARTMADRKRKEPEPSPSPPVVRDSPIIREFKREMNACMQTFNSLGWEKCVKTSDQLVIESVGEITVREITKGDGGDIWSTSNPNILLKVSKSYRDFCKERSILSVLNGLNGRVPDLYTVIDPKCHMMVMHKVGTKNWPGPLDSERPTNNQVADLIETLRDLHDAGFLHGDLYPRNARIDTEHAYLIDFEMSSLIPESGASVDASRRSDMMRLVGYVFTLNVPRGLEMYADMDVLGDDDRPDYEKWITSYRS
jgi:predicted Ser/Thr protein kinase